MARIRWKREWESKLGGFASYYFNHVYGDHAYPYLDASYWDHFRAWLETRYHCRWSSDDISQPQYLIFDRDEDATAFLLECG